MNAGTYVLVILAIAAVAIGATFVRAWLAARGARMVICPENHRPFGVELDARGAAVGALLGGTSVPLRSCSRWPEKAGCGQECLAQIESSPDGCLIRSILTAWFAGKSCAWCGGKIPAVRWTEWRPALVAADGSMVDWEAVRPEELPELLATHDPLCFDCRLMAAVRRDHPELLVNRPWGTAGHRA